MSELSSKERRVLAALELQSDAPLTAIARKAGLKGHTLRYALQRLLDRQIIARRPFINIYPLGYADYAIYFSIAPEKESTKDALLSYLREAERVSWLALFGGDYQYGMAVSARNGEEVRQFLNSVSERFPAIFFHKSLSIRTALTLFDRRYLTRESGKRRSIKFGHGSEVSSIDKKDHLILAGLESYEDLSLRDLSQKLDLPLTTLQQRVVSLRARGILQGFIYQVDATKFGMQPYRLLIETREVSTRLRQKLFKYAESSPFVCYFIECLGSWDYELGIEVTRGEDAIQINQELYRECGAELLSIKILPLFGHQKLKNYPFKTDAT